MKMIRSAFAMLLALTLCLGLCACGGKQPDAPFNAPASPQLPSDVPAQSDNTPSAQPANEPESSSSANPATRIITDRRDRQVEIPEKVETIVCLGSGAPRIAAYLQVTDMMIGAEDCDTGDVTVRRDYSWVKGD